MVTSCVLRVKKWGDESILHLNFIKDIHKLDEKEIQVFLDAYDELGRKINRFILYVEKEWNRNPKPETRN